MAFIGTLIRTTGLELPDGLIVICNKDHGNFYSDSKVYVHKYFVKFSYGFMICSDEFEESFHNEYDDLGVSEGQFFITLIRFPISYMYVS